MMCNAMSFVFNTKILFSFLFVFSILNIIYSKSTKKYDECDKFSLSHDCYYFPCLDAHYSCGPYSHLARFSYDLCLLTKKKYLSKLSQNAQFYFNRTNQCAMESLDNQLIEEKISEKFSCTHLQIMITNIYINCFQNKEKENKIVKIIDFCSIICDNLQAMIDLFLNLSNEFFNLNQLLFETGTSCGANIQQSTLHTVPSLLISICLDRKNANLKQDITSIMFNKRFESSDYDWI